MEDEPNANELVSSDWTITMVCRQEGLAILMFSSHLPLLLLVQAEPEAEAMADPMMSSSFNSPSNSLYSYRTLPPPTMMQMATESPSNGGYSNSGGGTRYTTKRPIYIPEKATTLRSPIYYPESPALPQYYPGPLSSSSERQGRNSPRNSRNHRNVETFTT